MRVVAFAGGVLGASLLGALDRHVRPVAVVASHAPGQPRRPDPLAALWARRRGVPLHYWPTWRDGAGTAALRALAPDLLLSLSYDLVLPAEALRTAPRAVNLHRGIAPDFKGAYSTTWALEHGAAEVGVTLHEMAPEVDAGAVLAQARLGVEPWWTAAEAIPAVEALALALFAEAAPALLAGTLEPRPQPPGGRTYGRELPPHALADPALVRRVRALHNPPWPAPHIELGGRRLEVAEAVPDPPPPDPGLPVAAVPPPPPPGARGSARTLFGGREPVWCADAATAAALARPGFDDRRGRTLDRTPLPGGADVVLDLRLALGIPLGVLLPAGPAPAAPHADPHAVAQAERAAEVGRARLACEATATAYAELLGDLAADDPWPLGTVPQGFRVAGPPGAAGRLREAGVEALEAGGAVVLPCHAGTSAAVAERVAADVRAVW